MWVVFVGASAAVVTLTMDELPRFVRSNPMSIVQFYAPWCAHCRDVAPKYEAAAREMQGKVGFGKVDGPGYNVTHYPSFILFFTDETIGQQLLPSEGLRGPRRDPLGYLFDNYYGGADDMTWWLTQMLQGKNPIEEERHVLKPGLYKDPAAVLELDARSFAAVTDGQDNRVWVVEFYSDRCVRCKHLVPAFVQAATRTKTTLGRSKIGFAALNARVFYQETDKWQITGLPWVTAWYRGKKLEDMTTLSDESSVVRWASRMHQMFWKSNSSQSSSSSSSRDLDHCLNADLCACDRGTRCRCAENPKSNGCCNMGCGDCTYLCAAAAERAKRDPEPDDDDEPSIVEALALGVVVEGKNATWREDLGARTWHYLHVLAANYPDRPTEADKYAMRWQVAGLAQFYPSSNCRAHLRRKLLDNIEPVAVNSRADLSAWFCRLHNLVNTDLGKPLQDCSLAALDALYYVKDSGLKSTRGGPVFLAAAYAADPAGYVASVRGVPSVENAY